MKLPVWICGVSPLLPSTLAAASLVLPASDTGFFNAMGRSSKNDGVVIGATPATFNYSAGAIDEVPPLLGPPYGGVDIPRKNYFTFDLTSVSGTITGATLELYMPEDGYGSPEASETFSIYGSIFAGAPGMTGFADVLSDVYSIFGAPSLTMAKDLYAKLGDTKGVFPAFATIELDEGDEGSMVSLSFTAIGLTYLNLFKGGSVVLAGELDTLNGVPGLDEFVFGYSSPLIPGVVTPDPDLPGFSPTPTLLLETAAVPEASTWGGTILLLGAGVGLICRRQPPAG